MSININPDYYTAAMIAASTAITGAAVLYKIGKKMNPEQPDIVLHEIAQKINRIANFPVNAMENFCKRCLLP
jgi:hypothetical protein